MCESNILVLNQCNNVGLDEADRMIDLGFEHMTRKYLRNPVYITIGDPNASAAERVRQHIVWIDAGSNNSGVNNSGNNNNSDIQPPITIFTNMKQLAKYLRQHDSTHHEEYKPLNVHVFKQFKEHKIDTLRCTNVDAWY